MLELRSFNNYIDKRWWVDGPQTDKGSEMSIHTKNTSNAIQFRRVHSIMSSSRDVITEKI